MSGASSRMPPSQLKVSSRRTATASPAPSSSPHHTPTSRAFLTDLKTNTLSFLDQDPAAAPHPGGKSLLSRDGGAPTPKLKVKSAMTPEAKSRVVLKPKTPANSAPHTPGALTGRPIRYDTAYRQEATPAPVTPAARSTVRLVTAQPAIGHSDSLGSLDGYALPGMEDVEAEAQGHTEAVSVTIRVRPPNAAEMRSNQDLSVWDCPQWDDRVIKLPKGREGTPQDREWVFDRILPPSADNSDAYKTSARAHVRSAMEGFNAVIFAYGQTASGKTFTLTGSPSAPGIIPLAVADLFAQIRRTPDREFLLRASYLELYNEAIIDLLSGQNGQGLQELSLREGKKGDVVINGLTECGVRTEEDVRGLLRIGEDNRKVGQTDWNARSSRSHCVFRITIESRARGEDAALGTRTPGGKVKTAGDKMTRISTLSIIDLAGSEKHTSSKERNVEGRHINQSLLTLKLVISKLADMASKRTVTHVPYRDSKLTRLLQPSLSGDALISVICTVSPSGINLSESLSTLSFAQGLKRVVLRAQKKELVDPQALIQQYQVEIAELRALLREKEDEIVASPMHTGIRRKSKGDREKDKAMERRLEELKSLILTSVNVDTVADGTGAARPLSPTKLKYPRLDFDRSTTELQEDLHASELKISELEEEVALLKRELEARPVDPDAKIMQLQHEVAGLRMIADDYERNLREPAQKVKEDVEREWKGRVQRLESQLESKTIWANRLDENFRAVSAENKLLRASKQEAESKVLQIIEWVNAALDPSSSGFGAGDASEGEINIPTLVVSQDLDGSNGSHRSYSAAQGDDAAAEEYDDFGPPPMLGGAGGGRQATLTLNAKMAKGMSTMDLQALSDRFGSLGFGSRRAGGAGGSRGMKMLSEESRFDLAGDLED